MTTSDFCFWLHGYTEIAGGAPNETQWQIIKDHLDLVFSKVTPQRAPRPTVTPPKLEEVLSQETIAAIVAGKGGPTPGVIRCCGSELPKQAAEARYCTPTKEPGVYTLQDTKDMETVGEVLQISKGPDQKVEVAGVMPRFLTSCQRINLADSIVEGPICGAPSERPLTTTDLRVGGSVRTMYDLSQLTAIDPKFTYLSHTC